MDELERKDRYARLLELYGSLLGEEQRRRAELSYFSDFSLAEIAEREGISRNAVHESIKAADQHLDFLEEELKLEDKIDRILEVVSRIEKTGLCSEECEEIRRILDYGV